MSTSAAKVIQVPEFLQKELIINPPEYNDISPEGDVVSIPDKATRSGMSQIERKTFISMVQGMTDEQIDIMLDVVPIGLIYDRLGRELNRNQEIVDSLNKTVGLISTDRMK